MTADVGDLIVEFCQWMALFPISLQSDFCIILNHGGAIMREKGPGWCIYAGLFNRNKNFRKKTRFKLRKMLNRLK